MTARPAQARWREGTHGGEPHSARRPCPGSARGETGPRPASRWGRRHELPPRTTRSGLGKPPPPRGVRSANSPGAERFCLATTPVVRLSHSRSARCRSSGRVATRSRPLPTPEGFALRDRATQQAVAAESTDLPRHAARWPVAHLPDLPTRPRYPPASPAAVAFGARAAPSAPRSAPRKSLPRNMVDRKTSASPVAGAPADVDTPVRRPGSVRTGCAPWSRRARSARRLQSQPARMPGYTPPRWSLRLPQRPHLPGAGTEQPPNQDQSTRTMIKPQAAVRIWNRSCLSDGARQCRCADTAAPGHSPWSSHSRVNACVVLDSTPLR